MTSIKNFTFTATNNHSNNTFLAIKKTSAVDRAIKLTMIFSASAALLLTLLILMLVMIMFFCKRHKMAYKSPVDMQETQSDRESTNIHLENSVIKEQEDTELIRQSNRITALVSHAQK